MTLRDRLRPFLHVTAAALMNMGIYLALITILMAILKELQHEWLANFVLSILVCAGYALCLFYITYLRRGIGEDKVRADYKDQVYADPKADLRLLWQRERIYFILSVGVILLQAVLMEIDRLIFGKLFFSHVLFPYAVMNFMGTCIPVPLVGACISAALICLFYALLALRYRRKAYRYWMGNNR